MRSTRYQYIYPIILAIFPALSLYVHNIHQLHGSDVFWTIVGVATLALLILLGTVRIYEDSHKAAIITTIFFLLLFSFSHVINSVSYLLSAIGLLERSQNLVRGEFADLIWLLSWVALLILAAILVWKYPKDLTAASRLLSVIAVAVLLSVLGQLMCIYLPRDG
jgi:hypothetical protein